MDLDGDGVRVISLVTASLAGFLAGIIIMVTQKCTVILERKTGFVPVPRLSMLLGGAGAGLSVLGSTAGALLYPSFWTFAIALVIMLMFGLSLVGVIRKNG